MNKTKARVLRPIESGVAVSLKSTSMEESKAALPGKNKAVREFSSREIVLKLIAWFEQVP